MNITIIGASAGIGLETIKRGLNRNHSITTLSRTAIELEDKKSFNMILGDVKTDKCGNFEEVYFFSASIYLRSILKNNPEKDFIDISSNNINSRINYLKNLIVKF